MLGFRLRNRSDQATKAEKAPAWSKGVSKNAATGQEYQTLDSFQLQADRFTKSDLVYIAVTRVAQMCAQQHRKLKIFNPDSPRDPLTLIPQEELTDHPFLKLWRQPNKWDSTFEFLEGTAMNLSISGNAFWHLDDGNEPVKELDTRIQRISLTGVPKAMWLIRPDRVRIIADPEEYIGAYEVTVESQKTLIDPLGVRHFKLFHPLQDLVGLSPVEPANYASASDVQSQKTNYALFRNAMRLSGVIESDIDEMDQDQLDLMEEYILERFTGDPEKAHQLIFLWSQFKYRELGSTMREAEFIEGSKMNRSRVFGVFGVHPAIVLSEDVNLANALVGEYVTLKFTIEPMLERIADDITPVLNLWDARPAEAHFVDIVIQDKEVASKIAVANAEAVQFLAFALGPEEGVAEARRQKLVTDEAEVSAQIQAASDQMQGVLNLTKGYP